MYKGSFASPYTIKINSNKKGWRELKYVGVIIVEEGGLWKMIHKPYFRKEPKLNNHILKLMLLEL